MALVALVSIVLFAVFTARATRDAFELVDHTRKVQKELAETNLALADAAALSRGYQLSGDTSFLELFEPSLDRVAAGLTELRRLTTDNPNQQGRIAEIEPRFRDLAARYRRRVEDRRAGVPTSYIEIEKRLRDEIRQLTAAMADEETRLLEGRVHRAEGESDLAVCTTTGAVAVALAMVGTAVWRLRHEWVARTQAQKAVKRALQESLDLYHQAPCGYHSLDGSGRFVQINDTELRWLGYPREEVVGKMRFSELLTPEGLLTFAESFPRFRETGEVRDLEFELTRRDGTRFCVSLNASAQRDANGAFVSSRSTMFDVTARRTAESRVRELNGELTHRAELLEGANKELEAFSYSVSHDLRAPLRHIDGFSSLLAKRAGDSLDATGRRYVETIAEASRRMGRLIDDLLLFSRTGRTAMRFERFPVGDLVREVLADLKEEIASRPIEWVVYPLPEASADRSLLRQVWVNLLSNAVKYTRPRNPARIEVGATTDEERGEQVFRVRDNGVGFEMAYVGKLFGVFQRLHRADEFEGTGIGLANVRRIVLRHGGRTWAESQPGEGATFFFTLPLNPSPSPALPS